MEDGLKLVKPRRRPGRERVAALLVEAAARVIAERGFEAATIAEVAARAGARVGSLDRVFPDQEALADAPVRRDAGGVDEAFAEVDRRAASMPVEDLADALVGLLVEVRSESEALLALLEARAGPSAMRHGFRAAALRHIARTPTLRAPRLDPEAAGRMAVVLLLNMKAMKALAVDPGGAEGRGASAELRDMTRLDLASKLAGPA